MSKKERQPDTSGFKTEDQLKEEAKQRAAEQAKIDALKKPAPPRKKKAENFWYHYKWHTIAGCVALVLVVFFLKDMLFRTDPDATILMTTQQYYSQETIDAIQASLESMATDFNGDGKVSITIDYIYSPAQPTEEELAEMDEMEQMQMSGGQQDYASTMKLTTVVAAGMDPLYIVDEGMYDHFLQMAAGHDEEGNPQPITEDTESMFATLEGIQGAEKDRLPLEETILATEPIPGDLTGLNFCLRLEEAMSRSKDGYFEYCRELLRLLAEELPAA